jgi:hypothetical protein
MSNAREVDKLETLRRDIRSGFEAIARGEFEEYKQKTTKDLAADIKKRGKQRLAELKRKTGTGTKFPRS